MLLELLQTLFDEVLFCFGVDVAVNNAAAAAAVAVPVMYSLIVVQECHANGEDGSVALVE